METSAVTLKAAYQFLNWLNTESQHDRAIPTLKYVLKRNENICLYVLYIKYMSFSTWIFITALFIIAKNVKNQFINWWTDKMWYIIIREYYSAIKSTEALLHTAAWISLENILREKSQSQRTTDSVIYFIRNAQNRHTYRGRR